MTSFTLHWSHYADPLCYPQVPFCKLFAQNICTQGEACRWRHCLTPEEYTRLFKESQPNLISISTAGRNTDTATSAPAPVVGTKTLADGNAVPANPEPTATLPPSSRSHLPVSPNATVARPSAPFNRKRPPPCSYFMKGTCRNGDKCPFSHDEQLLQSPSPAPSPTTPVCQNILLNGFCSNENCPECAKGSNKHKGSTGGNTGNSTYRQVSKTKSSNTPLCVFWPKGTCQNGDDCKFLHEGEPGVVGTTGQDDVYDNDAGGDGAGNDNEWNPTENNWESNNENTWETAAGDWNQDNNEWNTGENEENNNEDQNNWHTSDNNGWDQDWSTNDNQRDASGWNTNGSGKQAMKSNVCYRFQSGRCTYGANCHFSHDIDTGVGTGRGSSASRDHSRPRVPTSDKNRPGYNSRRSNSSSNALSNTVANASKSRQRTERWSEDVEKASPSSRGSANHEGGFEGSQGTQDGPSSGSRDNKINTRGRSKYVRGHASNSKRSVKPSGDDFYALHVGGRSTNSDKYPLSHDPDAAENDFEGDREGGGGNEAEQQRGDLNWDEGQDDGQENEHRDECTREFNEEQTLAMNEDGHVQNSSWEGQWETKPLLEDSSVRINKPCLYYAQGYCEMGDQCRFLHIDPSPESSQKEVVQVEELPAEDANDTDADEINTQDMLISEAAETDPGHPLIEHSLFGCMVVIGSNCIPDKVTTATDSPILLLEKPHGITEARVHDIVNRYGAIEEIIIEDQFEDDDDDLPPPMVPIRVTFQEMRSASLAAKSLNAQLAGAVPVEQAAPVSTWVKFKWPQATRAAWAHYPTITKAKAEADKFNNAIFQSKKITAAFVRPDKRQKDLFAIKLERLPISATRASLAEFITETTTITVSELTYIGHAQDTLRKLPHLMDFVEIAEDPTKIYSSAFVRFSSQETATSVVLKMNGKKQKFLGQQELSAERVWFSSYTVPSTVFKVIESEVKALNIQCEGRAHVEISDFGELVMIYVYASLEEQDTFAFTNISLQTICQGVVVAGGDKGVDWDDYLYSASSTKVIDALNSKNSFYIFPNLRTHKIHVLGSGSNQDKGVNTINKLLKKVRGACKEYVIQRNTIRDLVDGGLSKIQDEVGVTKLSLDVLRSVLIVRDADKELLEKISPILHFTPKFEMVRNGDKSKCLSEVCCICELPPKVGDTNAVVKLSCRHIYCLTCLQHALISATQLHSTPVRCIGQVTNGEGHLPRSCNELISYVVVRDLLPTLEYPNYLKTTFESYVLAYSDEYFFCPSLHCEVVYRRGDPGDIVRCSVCRMWNCLFCGSVAHDGMKCEDAQARRNIRV